MLPAVAKEILCPHLQAANPEALGAAITNADAYLQAGIVSTAGRAIVCTFHD